MVGYLKVHLRLNETLILILCSSHTLISYMDNSLHLFVLSSPLQSSSPSSIYNSPHPFQCPLLTPPHTYQYTACTNSSLSLHHSSPLPYCFGQRSALEIPRQQPLNVLRKSPMTSAGENREKRVYMKRSQINY